MALADVVKLGVALSEAAKVMKNEESFQYVGFAIPDTRLTYEDIEYLGQVVSKELPCEVGYKRQKSTAIVVRGLSLSTTSHLRLIGTRFQNYGGREMSNPSLGQIVNLCKNQKMNQIYVVECHDTKLVDTDQVLNQYPDVEIDALTVEMFSTVDYKRSTVFHQIFKVFI